MLQWYNYLIIIINFDEEEKIKKHTHFICLAKFGDSIEFA
jgi:hypothetical protein